MSPRPLFALVLLPLALLFAPACDDATAAKPTDYTALLQYLGDRVITPEHADFVAKSEAAVTAMKALEAGPTAATLVKAQDAWRGSRAAFRKLDAIHFGPIADLGISERIDLAPADGDRIDELLDGDDKLSTGTVADAGGNAKGFLGVEHLIFSTDGDGAALDALEGDDGARRRTLARLMSEEIAESAHQLEDAWQKGGYRDEFVKAGSGSKRYSTQRAAINDSVGAVGYAWEVVVGVRLAQPLGHQGDGKPDPSLDPTVRSDNAAADMTASMEGIEALYASSGYSSRVRTKSVPEDEQMTSQISDCKKTIVAMPRPFGSALVKDTKVVERAYDACDAGKKTWTTDITMALGATVLPPDQDGD